MFEIYKREIGSFFNSLTGYLVIIVYQLVNSLFMWVLPGDWNILESSYAGLDTLFLLSPWIFLFLVPAVSMRTLADEKRSGTLELLLTRPLSERQIIYGKYLAAVSLVVLALLPGIIYYISVYYLGEVPGNLDSGGILGSYLGLLFLASIYAACGVLASSLTDNQVVAFILAVLISLIMYIGFDVLAMLPGLKKIDEIIVSMGINEHYRSMSRGVVDIKDITYYLACILILMETCRLVLVSGKWKK
ncbi:MAG: gliding motility-associated ABC transporter permease subunit GldF [Marinilabiliaceae bacterium]|jgi:ABC-2 type transport system permease protein|nr:gliding motility-associated ABC transporter permease subunit GldF [Marinilabiliaceae bacterium]